MKCKGQCISKNSRCEIAAVIAELRCPGSDGAFTKEREGFDGQD